MFAKVDGAQRRAVIYDATGDERYLVAYRKGKKTLLKASPRASVRRRRERNDDDAALRAYVQKHNGGVSLQRSRPRAKKVSSVGGPRVRFWRSR